MLCKSLENFNMTNLTENSQVSTKWIESLALEELNMEESGVINFSEHLNPEYLSNAKSYLHPQILNYLMS